MGTAIKQLVPTR